MKDQNVEPYFDDFSNDNKFYKILFRPSVAVQARELNQLQSILQNQIKSQGDSIFKNGTRVIPGEFAINSNFDYVKLTGIGDTVDITNLVGTILSDNNTNPELGLQALVIHAEPATISDPVTLYVQYTNSSSAKVFANSASLRTLNGTTYTVTVAGSSSTGKGTIASVKKGVYYINGYFVLNNEQTIAVDKYNVLSTALTLNTRIGFTILEDFITPDDIGYDALLDNAQGSPNYGAPGAHRYFIDLILDSVNIGTSDTGFIELSRIVNGVLVKDSSKTDYSELEKTLARRTYDEAGNFLIDGFVPDIREHRDNNRGTWSASNNYIAGDIVTNSSINYVALAYIAASATAPTHTTGIVSNWMQSNAPIYNRGIYPAHPTDSGSTIAGYGNESKFAAGFSPGKAYVNGFEIQKISSTYLPISKPRTYTTDTSASISTNVGNFVQVTNVHNLPSLTLCPIVTIYSDFPATPGTSAGNSVGTCRIRGIEQDGTNTRLYLFDVNMNAGLSFARYAKTFYWQAGGSPNSATDFTATITPDTYSILLNGGVTVSSGTVTSIAGVNTTFKTDLVAGDWIYFKNDSGTGFSVKVSSITNDNLIVIPSTSLSGIITTTAVYRIQTSLVETNNNALLFPLPHKSILSADNYVYYVIESVGVASATGYTITLSTTDGTYESNTSNYYAQDGSGNTVNITSVDASAINTATLTFGSTPSTSYKVWATVRKVGTSKTKTLTSATQTFTYTNGASLNTKLVLSNTDVVRIVSIISNSVDISNWYSFDSGQTPEMYNYGTLTLIPAYPIPVGDVVVSYQYFVHGSGDFFDANSYTDYAHIPPQLRDAIDFRPRINNMALKMPKRGYNASANLTYYIPRKDKIAISNVGDIFDIAGSPSLYPGLPEEPSSGMVLCTLDIPAYTYTVDSIKPNIVNNKRYTMRDIGKLETRINNLEYYTSLSLLEQETANLSIPDAQGLDRFKNGFIVDNFSGHNIGDVGSADYVCAVDMENNELRPFTSQDNIGLIPYASGSSNLNVYGDLITLPLNSTTPHVRLAENSYASRTEFVNPFAVFTFIGDMKINPASDDWFEVNRRPDIVNNVDGSFNTISELAEKTGVLGTVWNAWQTQWSGKPIDLGTFRAKNAIHSYAESVSKGPLSASDELAAANKYWGGNAYSARSTTFDVTATQIGKARTGVNTKLVSTIENKVIDDKILSVATIPYIRSRYVLVQVKGLKPKTTFYPYFDNVDVSSYCTSARKLIYTPVSGTFDTSTNAKELLATDSARQINSDSQICLNVGDKIAGNTSGAKAIVVGKEVYNNPVSNALEYRLYVLNVVGTFTSSEVIVGDISSAHGTFVSLETQPTSLISSDSGSVNLLFNIPQSDSIRFRTGDREFKLIDANTPTGSYTSRGRATYSAVGVMQTKQATVLATRNAEIVEEAVSQNATITQTTIKAVAGTDTGWYDPLAQTFLIDCAGGAFLSKVDLYFAKIDNNLPITIEIREVVNGYPGKTVLPFSRVTLNPSDITLSSNTVIDAEGVSYYSYDTPTTISFRSPVQVLNNKEYALVVMSDSNNYKVWISNMGDTIPGTSNVIKEQPYNGVLFKSQNASTWTANQDQDLKFTIWRANFNTSTTAVPVLTNTKVNGVILNNNPIQTLNGSAMVRIWQDNHGFSNTQSVLLSGAPGLVNGATINGTWAVSNVTLDSYTITSSTTATATGYVGGASIKATRHIRFDTLQPNINVLTFPETSATFTSTSQVWGVSSTTNTQSIILNDNNNFTSSQYVDGSGSTPYTLSITGTLNSTNPSLSPIIDIGRASAILVSNKIDSPAFGTTNVAGVDQTTLLTGATFAFSGSTITGNSIPLSNAKLKSIIPGSYIQITGSTTVGNDGTYLVTDVNTTTGTLTVSGKTFATEASVSGTTLYYYPRFVDDITPVNSTTTSKYVSKEIKLANSSSTIRVKLSGSVPYAADIVVYYKVGNSATDFSKTNWTLLPPDTTFPKVAVGSDTFKDVDYTKTTVATFEKISIKIVMKSTNTAAVPRIKDLRIIACA